MSEQVYKGDGFFEITTETGEKDYLFFGISADRPSSTHTRKYPNAPYYHNMSDTELSLAAEEQVALAKTFSANSLRCDAAQSQESFVSPEFFIETIEDTRLKERALELLLETGAPRMLISA